MHIPPNLLAFFTLALTLTVSPISAFAKPSPPPPLQPHSRTSLPAAFFPKYNSQRVKLTYGPYTIPPMSVDNGMLAFGGQVVESPCTDCMITYMHAGLAYADGSPATADTGIWLHHTVWMNLGRPDVPASCCSDDNDDEDDEEETNPPGHHDHHRFHRTGDRFFASGNERTPVDFTRNGSVMAGYRISSPHEDTIAMGGELMNMDMDEKEAEVFLTMEIEYIPGYPREFRNIDAYWLDVGACSERGSNMPAYNDTVWELNSPPVRIPASRHGHDHDHGGTGKKHGKDGNRKGRGKGTGDVVFIAAHLHDGGVRAEIARDGVVICESIATYSPSTMDALTSHSSATSQHEHQQKSHIANLSTCADAEALGSTQPGDEWTVRAYYDTTLHAPMANMDGSLEPVMGIALVYVAVDRDAESGGHRHHHHHHHRSKKMKVFLAVGVLGLSGLLWAMWTAMHGRDWRGRRKEGSVKRGRVQLHEAGWYADDVGGKRDKQLEEEGAAAACEVGRYQDNE